MKKIINKKSILLIVTILLLSARMLYLYSIRCSHFIDEFYSMGFANSKGIPLFLYPVTDDDGTQHLKHFNEWSDGQDILSYLTVDEGEEFDFANVIDNKYQDTAPANFEIMIHFVSSFFPGTFSWAYPFSVNFVFFIGSLILVFAISYRTLRDNKVAYINAYICMVFFAFTIAGSGAFTFLRMYGVLSFYGLLMLFSIQRLLLDDSKKRRISYYIVLFISVFMGLFTHPLFVVYAFWLTLFVCLYLLFSKKLVNSIKLGSVVLTSLITFILLYPFKYERVNSWFADDNVTGYSYFTRLIYSNMHMFGESIGFYIPFTYANILVWLGIAFMICFCIMSICFLSRNEKWYKAFKKSVISNIGRVLQFLKDIKNNYMPINIIMFLTVVAYMLTVTAVTPVNTQHYVARYFMIGMFPMIICFVSLINSAWWLVKGKFRKLSFVASISFLVGLLLVQAFVFVNPFYFNKPYDDEEKFHELTSGSDIMIFGDSLTALYCLMVPLRDVDSFYFGVYTDTVEDITDYPDNDFYIMVRKDCFAEEESRAGLVDGLAIEGSTESFVYRVLSNVSYDVSVEKVEDFYSYAGDYAIYRVLKN